MTRPSFSEYRSFPDGLPGMLRIGSWDEHTYDRVAGATGTV